MSVMKKAGHSTTICLAAMGAALLFAAAPAFAAPGADSCGNLAAGAAGPGARIVSATYHADGADKGLPAHCEIVGEAQAREGLHGQKYAIRFRMRLPTAWNERFVFQGGGGLNGNIGDAMGPLSNTGPVAAAQGYAVVSQDSGHDASNADPARNGDAAFGFDPVARANYGHASLKIVADAAKAVIGRYFGRGPRYSYFVGCSKGGQEGMMFAQRYPEVFDGIIASAPGFSLPRAALAEAWDTASFASLVSDPATGKARFTDLKNTFTSADLGLVRTAVLKACDGLDGVADGIVADTTACTTQKVSQQLKAVECAGAKDAACLTPAQALALVRVMQGAHDSKGQPLYASWPWSAGLSSDGWRIWKLGSADGAVPPLNVLLGASSLASLFTTPPTVLGAGPQALLDYQMGFDFDRDAGMIYAAVPPFERSAWQDIGARSPDLDGFRARGAKLLVPHGDADPVFSSVDTQTWFDEVDARYGGQAAGFVRVFPVPGMCHCGGGLTTDRYDAFAALKAWVEEGAAPERIVAEAGQDTPWPGRTRPLCPYPLVARYDGKGDVERADSFVCKA